MSASHSLTHKHLQSLFHLELLSQDHRQMWMEYREACLRLEEKLKLDPAKKYEYDKENLLLRQYAFGVYAEVQTLVNNPKNKIPLSTLKEILDATTKVVEGFADNSDQYCNAVKTLHNLSNKIRSIPWGRLLLSAVEFLIAIAVTLVGNGIFLLGLFGCHLPGAAFGPSPLLCSIGVLLNIVGASFMGLSTVGVVSAFTPKPIRKEMADLERTAKANYLLAQTPTCSTKDDSVNPRQADPLWMEYRDACLYLEDIIKIDPAKKDEITIDDVLLRQHGFSIYKEVQKLANDPKNKIPLSELKEILNTTAKVIEGPGDKLDQYSNHLLTLNTFSNKLNSKSRGELLAISIGMFIGTALLGMFGIMLIVALASFPPIGIALGVAIGGIGILASAGVIGVSAVGIFNARKPSPLKCELEGLESLARTNYLSKKTLSGGR